MSCRGQTRRCRYLYPDLVLSRSPRQASSVPVPKASPGVAALRGMVELNKRVEASVDAGPSVANGPRTNYPYRHRLQSLSGRNCKAGRDPAAIRLAKRKTRPLKRQSAGPFQCRQLSRVFQLSHRELVHPPQCPKWAGLIVKRRILS